MLMFLPSSGRNVLRGFSAHGDLPVYDKDKSIIFDVFYINDSFSFDGVIDLCWYKYTADGDSQQVLRRSHYTFNARQGNYKIKLDFSHPDSNIFYDRHFYEVLKRTGSVAPGVYKMYLRVSDSTRETYSQVYSHNVDSLLPATSPIRRDINHSLESHPKSFLGMRLKKEADIIKGSGGGVALQKAAGKVNRTAKRHGLTAVHSQRGGKTYVDLYYEDWFAGRYEADNSMSLQGQLSRQQSQLSVPQVNAVMPGAELEQPSLLSQYKSQGSKKDKDEIKGEISLTTNMSSGQEEYSGVDNNYYEVRGQVELPVLGLPVDVEGLYTSQDAHREIKSSYFRVHYNVDEVKNGLQDKISSYNSKFSQAKAQGTGMQQIYQSALSGLEAQRGRLQAELSREEASAAGTLKSDKGIGDLSAAAKDTSGLRQAATGVADSAGADGATGEASKDKAKAADEEKRLAEKRKQLEALDKKIEKYRLLLAQYSNTSRFDSTFGYDKTKSLDQQNDLTYKQMSKQAANLLPDGQAKSFVNGITTMDAGMFAKTESKYTMSGQMMKGLDFGYDLGFCQAGIAAGKTEYIGRDGNLDKYTFYSAHASRKIAKGQKAELIYYGYSEDHNLIGGDNFFKNANISAPDFFRPVHIISGKYEGTVSKYVTAAAEVATSMQKGTTTDVLNTTQQSGDHMAYHAEVDGMIPHSPVSLQTTYDKTGSGFENNTLPVTASGTEQYKLAGRTDLMKGLVTTGVEYDYLLQSSGTSTGSNRKWGFDIKTNLKRYPNVSLSYKPFTTFRSYTDTLSVPQKPLVGSVWTGKASWQLRRHTRSYRLLLLYNKSSTLSDSAKTGTDLLQLTFMYNDKAWTASASVGHTSVTGADSASVMTSPNNTNFLSLSGGYALSKQLSLTCGQDIGVASFGFCRYSVSGGLSCRPQKLPVSVRVNMRYNTYELSKGAAWANVYSGSVDISYRFKTKMSAVK